MCFSPFGGIEFNKRFLFKVAVAVAVTVANLKGPLICFVVGPIFRARLF